MGASSERFFENYLELLEKIPLVDLSNTLSTISPIKAVLTKVKIIVSIFTFLVSVIVVHQDLCWIAPPSPVILSISYFIMLHLTLIGYTFAAERCRPKSNHSLQNS
jgi:hypothetical protein